jgi:hypothetical protein
MRLDFFGKAESSSEDTSLPGPCLGEFLNLGLFWQKLRFGLRFTKFL